MHHMIEQRNIILLLSTGVIQIEPTPTLMMIMMRTNQLSPIQATTMKFEGVLQLESNPEVPFRAFVNNFSTTAGADRASFRAKNLPVADWTGVDGDDDDEEEEDSDDDADDGRQVDTPALRALNQVALNSLSAGQKRDAAGAAGGSRKTSKKAVATNADGEGDPKKQCPRCRKYYERVNRHMKESKTCLASV